MTGSNGDHFYFLAALLGLDRAELLRLPDRCPPPSIVKALVAATSKSCEVIMEV